LEKEPEMPLQNRVDPFGNIHAVAARGMFTGNRGVIHDPETKTLLTRRWTTKAWIICDCDFRGRRREVMGRNAPSGNAGWTELFFLDEVTALAAGHRPCFYCRRERAVEFARCFAAGQGRDRMSAPEMDEVLHRERWASGGNLQTRSEAPPPLTPPRKGEGAAHVAPSLTERSPGANDRKSPSPLRGGARGGGMSISDGNSLPVGTVVAQGDRAFVRTKHTWLEWTFDGWRSASSPGGDAFLLTPHATIQALTQGYAPVWHPSAGT
jgi:hypothetical protein